MGDIASAESDRAGVRRGRSLTPEALLRLASSALSVGVLWGWYIYAGADVLAASMPAVDATDTLWCKVAQFLALMAAALFSSRQHASRGLVLAGVASGASCILLASIAPLIPLSQPAVLLLCSLLGGFAYGVLLVRWASANLSAGYTALFFITGLSIIISAVWRALLLLIPAPATPIALSLFLLVSGLLIMRLETDPYVGNERFGHRRGTAGSVTLFASLAIAGGAVASLLVNSWVATDASAFSWEIVPLQLLLFVAMALVARRAAPELVMALVIGSSCVAVLCALALPAGHPALSVALFVCTRFLLAFSLVVALWRCSLLEKRPLARTGEAFCAIFLASLLAYVLSRAIPSFEVSTLLIAAVLLAFALVLIVASLLFSLQQQWQSEAAPAPQTDNARAGLDAQCRELAAAGGLTERECDVLCLLARGNSLKGIADKLVVSENTVKSHRRHIYQKLGINSRQSLIDLIDAGQSDRIGDFK